MNARELHDKWKAAIEIDICPPVDKADDPLILLALDLLARVEESEDELVRELRECETIVGNLCAEGRCPKMSVPVRDEDEDMRLTRTMQKAAATIVALKAHAEAMANGVEGKVYYADAPDVCEAVDAYRAAFPKDAP